MNMQRNDVAAPQYAIQVIREMIASGEVKPGETLPSQRDLSIRLNVSRPALREAISALEILGMVKASAGRGVFVCDPSERASERVSRETTHTPSPAEVLYARLSLQPEIAALAAHALDSNALNTLKRIKDRIASALGAGELEKSREQEADFFKVLNEAVSPHLLADLDRIVMTTGSAASGAVADVRGRHNEKIVELAEIIDALEYRDNVGAYRSVRRYILGEASRQGIQIMSFSR